MKYGKILKAERIAQGISQEKLAKMAGVTKRAIAYWESEQKNMSIESADKVFSALNVKVTIGNGSRYAKRVEVKDG